MKASRVRRRARRDYSKPHRLFVEDTPREVRAILEVAAGIQPAAPAEQRLPDVSRFPPR